MSTKQEVREATAGSINAVFICEECYDELDDAGIVSEHNTARFYPAPHSDEAILWKDGSGV